VADVGGRDVRFCGASAYVDPQILDGDTLPLTRLRYGGSAAGWGFAIHLPGKDRYQDAILPTGGFAGLPEDALVAYYTFVLFITTCVATYFKLPRSYARMAVLIAVCQLFPCRVVRQAVRQVRPSTPLPLPRDRSRELSILVSLYVVVVLAVTTACVLVAAETSRVDKDADLVDQRAGERCPR
jgi:hypothetical protein